MTWCTKRLEKKVTAERPNWCGRNACEKWWLGQPTPLRNSRPSDLRAYENHWFIWPEFLAGILKPAIFWKGGYVRGGWLISHKEETSGTLKSIWMMHLNSFDRNMPIFGGGLKLKGLLIPPWKRSYTFPFWKLMVGRWHFLSKRSLFRGHSFSEG